MGHALYVQWQLAPAKACVKKNELTFSTCHTQALGPDQGSGQLAAAPWRGGGRNRLGFAP